MKTLNNLSELDEYVLSTWEPKLAIKEQEYSPSLQMSEEVFEAFKKSRMGYISICKSSDNSGYLSKGDERCGWTYAFGEGLALWLEDGFSWYNTSTIQKINWFDYNSGEFFTLNSRYSFIFNEITSDQLKEFYNERKAKETK